MYGRLHEFNKMKSIYAIVHCCVEPNHKKYLLIGSGGKAVDFIHVAAEIKYFTLIYNYLNYIKMY